MTKKRPGAKERRRRAQDAIEKLKGREFTSGDMATLLQIDADAAKHLCISLVRSGLVETTLRFCVKGMSIFRFKDVE